MLIGLGEAPNQLAHKIWAQSDQLGIWQMVRNCSEAKKNGRKMGWVGGWGGWGGGGGESMSTNQIWWTISLWASPGLMNSCHFLASGVSSSFCASADKPLIGFALSIVSKLIMGLPRSEQILVTLLWIPIVFWPLIGRAVSVHSYRQSADPI